MINGHVKINISTPPLFGIWRWCLNDGGSRPGSFDPIDSETGEPRLTDIISATIRFARLASQGEPAQMFVRLEPPVESDPRRPPERSALVMVGQDHVRLRHVVDPYPISLINDPLRPELMAAVTAVLTGDHHALDIIIPTHMEEDEGAAPIPLLAHALRVSRELHGRMPDSGPVGWNR